MSHPTPPPYGQQPPHGHRPQPGYGHPQQPYTGPIMGGPRPYQPPPEPKKPMSGWAVAGITLGVIFFLGLVAGLVDDDDDSSTTSRKPATTSTTPSVEADDKPASPTPAKAPTTKAAPAPQKPKVVQYTDGDYMVGEDIPAGTYESKGAKKSLFEFCSVTTDPPEGSSKFPQLKSANANERIIITLTKADGVVSISGCEPLTPRK